MNTFDGFKGELRDALVHLYDPDYLPSDLLAAVVGSSPHDGPIPVQSAVLQMIGGMKPEPDVPSCARANRIYASLHHRFVLKLTQEQTAECMNISVRQIRRVQREATHTLARLLWEHSLAREASKAGTAARQAAESPSDAQMLDWRAQVKQDVASLRKSSPGAVANVGETLRAAVDLERVLAVSRGVRVRTGTVTSGLIAPIHPSALRQVLIMAMGQAIRHTSSPGLITVSAECEDGSIQITLDGIPTAGDFPPDGSLIGELLASLGGSVEVDLDRDGAILRVTLPSAGEVTVLVVDDNLDLVHYFRRCTAGTRYRIIHEAEGSNVLETVRSAAPDIIVLDIMLPDVDGWELLAQLYEQPETRPIPVIVCSVIREEELALALGAATYLAKPVEPRQFLQALDQVLERTS